MAQAIPFNQVHQRLDCVDLPDTVKQNFWKLVSKWVLASGEEWATNRVKSIKQDILNSVANDNFVLESQWIRKKNPYQFYGVVGSLQRLAKRSTRTLKEVLAIINLHTIFIADDLTNTQKEKFVKAVTTSSHPSSREYIQLIRRSAVQFSKRIEILPAPTLLSRSQGKESHEKRISDEILTYFSSPKGRKILTEYSDVVYPAIKDVLPSKRRFTDDTTIGRVCYTQNPGYKARFFAAPHIWIQHVLEPLGKEIYDIVHDLPWDCTFDQTKGFPHIQQALRDKRKTYCYDLSSATDRFPIDLQIHALRKLLPLKSAQRHISLLAFLVRQPWKFLDQELTWRRGQPLGMYPSFGMFTLTHGLMLFALNNFEFNNTFFVLGDDVIITDENLSIKYKQFLIDCEIDFNPSKSIISDKFGEFAGRLIFKDSVLPSRKWSIIKDDSLIQFLQNWGPAYTRMVPKKYRDLFNLWSRLPEPYGLGYNPDGLSINDRLEGFEQFLLHEDAQLEYLVDYRSLNMKRFTHEGVRYYLRDLPSMMDISDALDQRAFRAVAQLIPALSMHYKLSGMNLYTVSEDLGLSLKHGSTVPSSSFSKIMRRFSQLMKRD